MVIEVFELVVPGVNSSITKEPYKVKCATMHPRLFGVLPSLAFVHAAICNGVVHQSGPDNVPKKGPSQLSFSTNKN